MNKNQKDFSEKCLIQKLRHIW